VTVLSSAGHSVRGVDVPDIDITDRASVDAALSRAAPDVVVNPAAFTAVDACETGAARAFAVNAVGAMHVALAAAAAGAQLIHFSTDYVFDGRAAAPYTETDPTGPASVYGRSKLAGEWLVAANAPHSKILRIAWLYGANGANFVKTIVKAAIDKQKAGEPLTVVDDQTGCPTCTLDVCRQVAALLEVPEYGLFHSVSGGRCTWYEFTRYILERCGIGTEVVPCTTDRFPRPAPRPRFSALENARLNRLGRNLMPQWRQAFDSFYAVHAGAIAPGAGGTMKGGQR